MTKRAGNTVPYIYALRCPCTHLVRYVGKANSPQVRYAQHLRECKRSASAKDKWLQGLKEIGQRPEMLILERAVDWEEAERRWISHFPSGQLLNVADGGVPRWYDKGKKASNWHRKVVARYTNLAVNCCDAAQALRFKDIAAAFRRMQQASRKAGAEDQYEAHLESIFGEALS